MIEKNIMESIADDIHEILVFRQNSPGCKGNSMRSNDEKLIPVHKALSSLKENFQLLFGKYNTLDFTIETSSGIGNFPHVIYIAILSEGQKVSDGIFTAICFDIKGKGFVAGCIESVMKPKGLNTKKIDPSIININGASNNTKYNNSFVNPKIYFANKINIEELINYIHKSMDMALDSLGLINLESGANIGVNINDDLFEYDLDAVNRSLKKITRNITLRIGQKKFREELLAAYDSKCAISGCAIIEVLEAAHIDPYGGKETNHIQNGIILRADLHLLFDSGLITINASTYRILVHHSLKDTIYYDYHNNELFTTIDKRYKPSSKSLNFHNIKVFKMQ